MPASRFRRYKARVTRPVLLLIAVSLFSFRAFATPVVEGAPRWSTTGPGISELGSRATLHADLTREAPLALELRDGLQTSVVRELALEARIDGAGTRRVTFDSWGWREELPLAEGTLRAQVFTASRDLFALILEVEQTGPTPVPVTFTLSGAETPRIAVVPEGATLVPVEAHWELVVELSEGAPVGLLIAGASLEEARWEDEVQEVGPVTDWITSRDARWSGWTHSTAAVEGDSARIAEALALLRMAHVDGAHGELPVRAKGRLPTLALEDLGLVARALADQEPARAQALLEALLATRGAGGRLAAELSPAGMAAADVTRVPRFLAQWLAVAERSGAQAPSIMSQALEVEREAIAWWTAERDRDRDAALECNGGLEAGTPGSPRLTEVWTTDPDVAVNATSGRTPLDCVEAGAWVHALAVEAARLAEALGQDSQVFRSQAIRRSLEVEDPTNGHWNPERAGWFDYVRAGDEEARQTLEARTHVLWSPMTTGLARESVRARAVGEDLLAPGVFWTEHGVASVALDQGNVRVDPAARWQGAIQPEVDWSALVALSRYGFEAEAAALRARVLARPFVSAVEARTGEALGSADDAVAASVFLLAAAHADEAEVFLFQRGGLAKERRGHFQRIFRPGDGRLLLEVDSGDPRLLPELTLRSDAQLFSGAPMSVAVGDPEGRLAGRQVKIALPAFSAARGEVQRADGSRVPFTLVDGAWQAQAGDTLHLQEATLAGTAQGCGCSGSGGAGQGAGLLALLFGLLFRARGARSRPSWE